MSNVADSVFYEQSSTATARSKRAQRARARAAGLCGICCTGQPSPGFKTCDNCRATSRDKTHELYAARRQLRALQA